MDYVFNAADLSVQYGNETALNRFSMHVPKGSIYGFVGENGAGKTTLIRTLCGLQRPASGTYAIFGIAGGSREISDARRRIGAMVESPALYADMTATENMIQQYRILGLSSFDSIPGALQRVGLAETGNKKVQRFSQGMRQKLGIAMALAGNPEFVVLDEPVNGLDPQGIVALRQYIRKLNEEQGVTFLISSHILDELSRLATHYGFIHHGRMLSEMTAGELEQACGNRTLVEVSDTAALAGVLDRMQIKYRLLSPTQAEIYAQIDVPHLMAALSGETCILRYCWQEHLRLETYFAKLVGGEQNA